MRRSIALCLEIVLTAAWPLLAATPARAQGSRTAAVAGVVTDSAGVSLVEVRLVLTNTETGRARTLRTSHSGEFSFVFLPSGDYTLLIERLGYRPRFYPDLRLTGGRHVRLTPMLGTTRAAESVDTVRLAEAAPLEVSPGVSMTVPGRDLLAYPGVNRDAMDAGRFSTSLGAGRGFIGDLPSAGAIRVDGIRRSTLRLPDGAGTPIAAAALPLSMLDAVALTTLNPDVEWSSAVGGSIDVRTRSGGLEPRAMAYGAWGSRFSEEPSPEDGSPTDVHGGFFVSAPIRADTLGFLIGVDARHTRKVGRLAVPDDAESTALLGIARDSFGLDVPANGAYLESWGVVSGLARLDWRPSGDRQVTLDAGLAVLPDGETISGVGGAGRTFSASNASIGFSFFSVLGETTAQELRLGFDTSRRELDDVDALGLASSAAFPVSGLSFGSDPVLAGRAAQHAFRLGEVLYLDRGDHQVKLGGTARLASFSRTRPTSTELFYSSPDALAANAGYFVQTTATDETSFSLPHLTLFAQDDWSAAPGLNVLFGLRFDGERLPASKAVPDQTLWLVTGIENTDLPKQWGRLSPRVGFAWRPRDTGRLSFFGSLGEYSGDTSVDAWSEALAAPGDRAVARGTGALGEWGAIPDSATSVPSVTLLDREYASPRSAAADLGFALDVGEAGRLTVTGIYRRTDLLARPADLGRLSVPPLHDQYGRPVYGTLEKHGGLLVPADTSSRRFAAFDRITAVNLDGESTYRAVSVTIEKRFPALSWFAGYTWSATEDNVAAGPRWIEPGPFSPDSADSADWMTGTADTDVPNRLVSGIRIHPPAMPGIELAALYRYRSGIPFTPGFRRGVDANADGVFGNDPAFVDASLPGMDAVLSRWSCLEDSSGELAGRNSCRTDGIQSFDARLTLRPGRIGRLSPEIVIDGLDLFASRSGYPDTALLLVDRGAALATDPETHVVTVPVKVNDHFGESFTPVSAGRELRVGVRLVY